MRCRSGGLSFEENVNQPLDPLGKLADEFGIARYGCDMADMLYGGIAKTVMARCCSWVICRTTIIQRASVAHTETSRSRMGDAR